MVIEDPIVAEVRKYREEHAAFYGHNIQADSYGTSGT